MKTAQKRKSTPARKPAARGVPEEASVSREEALPGREEIASAFLPVRLFLQNRSQDRVRDFLRQLAGQPPQVLLLEGGTSEERLAAAHYWMLLLNCEGVDKTVSAVGPDPASLSLPGLLDARERSCAAEILEDAAPVKADPQSSSPCLSCSACIRMVTHQHRDCFFLDGTAGSIKIDDVRALRGILGEPPREARFRVVIFREAQALVEAAANALLKSFEEPRPATSFLLLTPQRERLLPTLVSRSFVLTLPWPDEENAAERDSLAPWEAVLCTFLRTGKGFLEKSGVKGALDVTTAHALTNLCRRCLVRCIKARQKGGDPGEGLESLLALMPEGRLRMLDEALAECQDSLMYGVNPVLVLEWLVTRMYFLLPRSRQQ